MTTDYVTHFDLTERRAATLPNERVAAAVTAIAFVLLLPAASLLMSVLTA